MIIKSTMKKMQYVPFWIEWKCWAGNFNFNKIKRFIRKKLAVWFSMTGVLAFAACDQRGRSGHLVQETAPAESRAAEETRESGDDSENRQFVAADSTG